MDVDLDCNLTFSNNLDQRKRFLWLTVVCLSLTFASCSTRLKRVYPARNGMENLESLKTPQGFAITPWEADQMVRSSRRLSLKHVYHLYADDRYYYVLDGYLGSNSFKAISGGIKMDGQSGRILDDES